MKSDFCSTSNDWGLKYILKNIKNNENPDFEKTTWRHLWTMSRGGGVNIVVVESLYRRHKEGGGPY